MACRAAISTGLADFTLPPEEMPQKLLSFARHPYAAKADRPQTLLLDEDNLARIFALLRERARVDFTFYKPSTVIRRIERRMTVNQVHDLREYVRFMEDYPGGDDPLSGIADQGDQLLPGSGSVRSPETQYLPALFKRVTDWEIRFWIAACSTGEEAYSLAMLSREVLEQMDKRLEIKIFATDIDHDAIQRQQRSLSRKHRRRPVPRLLAK